MSTNSGELEQFWREVQQHLLPISALAPIYRLYYDDQGDPLFYSTEDLPGNYIEIDLETFSRSSGHVRVVNGQLVKKNYSRTVKLVPGDQGTPCDPRDITVVISEDRLNIKWQRKNAEN